MAKKSLPYQTRNLEFDIRENALIARLAAGKLRSPQAAVTLGKTVYLWRTTAEDFLQNQSWAKHELCHLRQYKQYGFLKFILIYLTESLKHGYFNNRFEAEAREAETKTEEIIIQHGP